LFLAPSKIVLIAELMNICLLPASPNGLLWFEFGDLVFLQVRDSVPIINTNHYKTARCKCYEVRPPPSEWSMYGWVRWISKVKVQVLFTMIVQS
jgi:hypothetical protein